MLVSMSIKRGENVAEWGDLETPSNAMPGLIRIS